MKSIEDLGLSVRVYWHLKGMKIDYLEQIPELSKQDLLKFKPLGKKGLIEIEALLEENNLKLKEE